jgi:P-type Cu+ transporter
MIIDPVCGMHVDPKAAPAFSIYNEHTFYFCCDGCKEKFEANPELYVGRAQQANPEGYLEQNAA